MHIEGFDIDLGSCSELPEDPIVENESLEEPRYAGRSEVLHTAYYVPLYDWEKTWKPEGADKCPLKGRVRTRYFFTRSFVLHITKRPPFYCKFSLAFPLRSRFTI